MSVSIAQDQLIKLLEDNLPTGYTKAQIEYPNLGFITKNNDPRIVVSMNILGRANTTATGGYSRTRGIFTINLELPCGEGSRQAIADAEIIQAAFHNAKTLNVRLLESEVSPKGIDGDFYIVQINNQFYFED